MLPVLLIIAVLVLVLASKRPGAVPPEATLEVRGSTTLYTWRNGRPGEWIGTLFGVYTLTGYYPVAGGKWFVFNYPRDRMTVFHPDPSEPPGPPKAAGPYVTVVGQ